MLKLPNKSLDTLNREEAQQAIMSTLRPGWKENKQFLDGDHWQNGLAWVGPMPVQKTRDAAQIIETIKRNFVSKNTILEVVNRRSDGLLGREPVWSVALKRKLKDDEQPTDEEKKLLIEATDKVKQWWNSRQVNQVLKEALYNSLTTDHGVMRAFIPRGLSDESGKVKGKSITDAVYLEVLSPDLGAVVKDPDDMKDYSFAVWEIKDKRYMESSFVVDQLAEEKLTKVRFTDGTGAEVTAEFKLGGRILMFDLEAPRMITQQVRENQMSLNKTFTMLGRNTDLAGFIERTILNGQQMGKFMPDPDRPGERVFVPSEDSVKFGPNVTSWVAGIKYQDAEGNEQIANPSVVYRDPVPATTFKETADIYRSNILEDVRQSHILINSDATTSGVSRIQARADYLASLKDLKPNVDRAIEWLLNLLLSFEDLLSGETKFKELEVVADIRVTAGPMTAEEIDALVNLVEKELMARETAMTILETADVDEESARIVRERLNRPIPMTDLASVGWSPTDKQLIEMDSRAGFTARTVAEIEATRKREQEEQLTMIQTKAQGFGGE